MRRITLFLFYLLILFLPTQSGRHFFFDFSGISGIRSDYLAPTVYFTDIIVVFLIAGAFWLNKKIKKTTPGKPLVFLLFVVCYLLFNAIFVAANKGAALYKFVKILEFFLLGIAIYRLKPKLPAVIGVLSIGVFYSSVIAIWQFLLQKSTGIFWWLGERTFYAATPGIAALSYNGSLLLRPYATFPHPNVLGGFLAVVLPLVLYYSSRKRSESGGSRQAQTINLWQILCLILGLIALILSFSRAAWFAAGFGFGMVVLEKKYQIFQKLKAKKGRVLSVFYLLLMLSVAVPVFLPNPYFSTAEYWRERVSLIKAAVTLISSNLLFGVGLNNSIVQLHNYIPGFPGLFVFQPVHNIYLLVLAETGITGFTLFLSAFTALFRRIMSSYSILFITVAQLLFLGFFDHYPVTIQQGQLMFVIFTALSFIPKVAY